VREKRASLGESIQIRRLQERIAITTQITPAKIVGENEYDIRPGRRIGGDCAAAEHTGDHHTQPGSSTQRTGYTDGFPHVLEVLVWTWRSSGLRLIRWVEDPDLRTSIAYCRPAV
jgi:hypothetical protein